MTTLPHGPGEELPPTGSRSTGGCLCHHLPLGPGMPIFSLLPRGSWDGSISCKGRNRPRPEITLVLGK